MTRVDSDPRVQINRMYLRGKKGISVILGERMSHGVKGYKATKMSKYWISRWLLILKLPWRAAKNNQTGTCALFPLRYSNGVTGVTNRAQWNVQLEWSVVHCFANDSRLLSGQENGTKCPVNHIKRVSKRFCPGTSQIFFLEILQFPTYYPKAVSKPLCLVLESFISTVNHPVPWL